ENGAATGQAGAAGIIGGPCAFTSVAFVFDKIPPLRYMRAMSLFDTVTSTLAPVHRDGWPFIAILAAVAVILFWLDLDVLAWIVVIVTAWCAYFFRDPERVTPLRPGLVISPADGRVSAIEDVIPPPELDLDRDPVTRISLFRNI